MKSMVRCGALSGLVVLAGVATAPAGVFNDVARGLQFLNFDLQGEHNILSGGADFRAVTAFQGNVLDFGVGELTLQGPLSFEVSTGDRFLNTLDLSMQTALTSRNDASPVSYSLLTDICGQETQINGNVLLDSNLSINEFGCYKFNLQYSVRQDMINDGPMNTSELQNDFDIGPIAIEGNLVTDALALLLDPLFTRSGGTNPLEPYTGRAQLAKAFEAAQADVDDAIALDALDTGATGLAGEPVTLATAAAAGTGVQQVIPEPMTLLLAGVGGFFVCARRGPRRVR